MEHLSYALEGRGFLFPDNMELPVDALARNRNTLKEWNSNPFYDVDKSIYGPSQEITESTEFVESGIADILKKSAASNSSLGVLCTEMSNGSVFSLEPIPGEGGLGAMFNHSAKSNNPMPSSIDLKFRELNDYGEVRTSQSSKESSVLSSPEASFPTRKSQSKNLHSQSPTSQVNGQSLKRNSVLSSVNSSMQAKRIRTTNLHSEVPLCQVYGCNKDLSSSKDYHKRHKVCDEHSKTAIVVVNGIEQRFCQQCSRFHVLGEFDEGKRSCRKRLAGHNERRRKPQFDTHWGSRFMDMTSQKRVPFLFPEILPSSFFYQENYKVNNDSKKHLEHKPFSISQLAMSVRNGQSPARSIQQQYGMRKQELSKVHLGAISSVREFSTGQSSSCALSLLSAHPQNLLHGSTDISPTPPLTPIELYSSEVVEIQRDGHDQRLNSLNSKHCLPPEGGPTMDLVQLSSLLQRVEQQKNSVQVKQENDIFSSFTST